MLSSTKAVIIFQLLLASAALASRPYAQFPPAPFQYEREKKTPKLYLSEKENPFWKTKSTIRRKMIEERLIAVSVSKSNLKEDLISYDVKGAGVVHAPANIAFKVAQEFNKLTKVSSNFKSAFYDEKNRQLFLVVEALGFETRMILTIDVLTTPKRNEIQFEVVWGELKGMKGAIGFETIDEESCEVSILSHYQAKSFPLPRIFMGFAFEVMTQKVAGSMRNFIESQK